MHRYASTFTISITGAQYHGAQYYVNLCSNLKMVLCPKIKVVLYPKLVLYPKKVLVLYPKSFLWELYT